MHSSCHALSAQVIIPLMINAAIAHGQAGGQSLTVHSECVCNINEGLSGKWIRSLFSGLSISHLDCTMQAAVKDKIRTILEMTPRGQRGFSPLIEI